jgi:hypothetical protein
MRFPLTRWTGAPLLALLAIAAPASTDRVAQAPPRSTCALETTERIVVVGDIHGAYDRFVAILRRAGIIDARRRWAGGRATFVQTGDIVDRGPASRAVLDLLRRLETEAPKAGGRVHVLLGNHEVMRMFGNRTSTSQGEYGEFQSFDSDPMRDRGADRPALGLDVQPGAAEMQVAFSPSGDYGRWLRSRDTMVMINRIAFLHGGISPTVAALGCDGINQGVRDEIKAGAPAPDPVRSLSAGPNGPLWYRGMVEFYQPAMTTDEVRGVMRVLGAHVMVVGHTFTPDHRMRPVHGGRVVLVDTGMVGGPFFPGGVASALEIAGGVFTAIYEGHREPLMRISPR